MSLEPLDIDLNQHLWHRFQFCIDSLRGIWEKKIKLNHSVENVNSRLKFDLIEKIVMQIWGVEWVLFFLKISIEIALKVTVVTSKSSLTITVNIVFMRTELLFFVIDLIKKIIFKRNEKSFANVTCRIYFCWW